MNHAAVNVTMKTCDIICNFKVMEAVRKIVETSSDQLTIAIPEEYRNRKLEVIVLPLEEKAEEDKTKKYDFSDLVGKLQWKGDAVAEQRRLRDEWD